MSKELPEHQAAPLVILGDEGEKQWNLLLQHVEWSEGFWLVFLFASSPVQVREIERRLEDYLSAKGANQKVIRPSSPQELHDLTIKVFAEETQDLSCLWLEAMHLDPPDHVDAPDSWKKGWEWFLLRTNERRERLRRQLSGGLVLTAPIQMKPLFREAAPDLWSIRSLVLEVPPMMTEKQLEDDNSKALSNIARALDLLEESVVDGETISALFMLADAPAAGGEQTQAERIFEAALSMARRRREETSGLSASMLRDVMLSLKGLGNARRQLGKLVEAQAHLLEALTVIVEIEERWGESSETLSDRQHALNSLALLYDEMDEAELARSTRNEAEEIAAKQETIRKATST